MSENIITLTLDDDEALALAQMCRRIIYEEIRRMSGSETEHWQMDSAISKLRRALAEAGYAPR